jgi:hypothetical protein
LGLVMIWITLGRPGAGGGWVGTVAVGLATEGAAAVELAGSVAFALGVLGVEA